MARGWHRNKLGHSVAARKGWSRRRGVRRPIRAVVVPRVGKGTPIVHHIDIDPRTGRPIEGVKERRLGKKTIYFTGETLHKTRRIKR